jgi:hypothetical protein
MCTFLDQEPNQSRVAEYVARIHAITTCHPDLNILACYESFDCPGIPPGLHLFLVLLGCMRLSAQGRKTIESDLILENFCRDGYAGEEAVLPELLLGTLRQAPWFHAG